MIWRCYLVWSSRIKFVVLPAILCILNNVAALVIVLVSTKHSFDPTISGPLSELSSAVPPTVLTAFLYGALASNTVLTSMIAGRIYYVIRNDLTLLGPRARRTYKTAIAVSIESGILYPVALAVEAAILPAIHQADPANKIHYQLLAIFGKTMYLLLVQIVVRNLIQDEIPAGVLTIKQGIAPTLIIIRIGLGSCVVDAKYGGSESQSDGRIEDGSSTTNRDCTASSVSLRFRKPDDSEVHVIPSDASTE
ncbi:hypothetical protein VNI00_000769 [Paramarasmius palmivorus]|uniref:Integral membrane protein n=1 Tax=Paramarasmius palmivorus TaxID=297713 RepID=A0AAW0E9Y3_9AGAR